MDVGTGKVCRTPSRCSSPNTCRASRRSALRALRQRSPAGSNRTDQSPSTRPRTARRRPRSQGPAPDPAGAVERGVVVEGVRIDHNRIGRASWIDAILIDRKDTLPTVRHVAPHVTVCDILIETAGLLAGITVVRTQDTDRTGIAAQGVVEEQRPAAPVLRPAVRIHLGDDAVAVELRHHRRITVASGIRRGSRILQAVNVPELSG